jgi:hypothetical protein
VAVVVAAAVVAVVVVGWRPLDATPVHTYTHNNREKMNFYKERKKRTTRWADMVCKSPAFSFRSGDVIVVWNRKEKNAHRAIQLTSQRANAKIRKKKKK